MILLEVVAVIIKVPFLAVIVAVAIFPLSIVTLAPLIVESWSSDKCARKVVTEICCIGFVCLQFAAIVVKQPVLSVVALVAGIVLGPLCIWVLVALVLGSWRSGKY